MTQLAQINISQIRAATLKRPPPPLRILDRPPSVSSPLHGLWQKSFDAVRAALGQPTTDLFVEGFSDAAQRVFDLALAVSLIDPVNPAEERGSHDLLIATVRQFGGDTWAETVSDALASQRRAMAVFGRLSARDALSAEQVVNQTVRMISFMTGLLCVTQLVAEPRCANADVKAAVLTVVRESSSEAYRGMRAIELDLREAAEPPESLPFPSTDPSLGELRALEADADRECSMVLERLGL